MIFETTSEKESVSSLRQNVGFLFVSCHHKGIKWKIGLFPHFAPASRGWKGALASQTLALWQGIKPGFSAWQATVKATALASCV